MNPRSLLQLSLVICISSMPLVPTSAHATPKWGRWFMRETLPSDCRSHLTEAAPELPPKSLRDIVDSRIKRGQLTRAQFDDFREHLIKRQVAPGAGVLAGSWAWTFLRDHYHWQDALSQHQSNLLRGIGLAFIFDWHLRSWRRDESITTTYYVMALLAGANIISETPVIGNRFDPGDLTAGALGVLAVYIIQRVNEYTFTKKLTELR